MKKVYISTITVVVITVIGYLAISGIRQSPNLSPVENTPTSTEPKSQLNKAPDFSLQDYTGKTVSFADFAGKPLVINSWAAWCPFCKQELPDFAAAQKEFGDKVTIIAIDRAESLNIAKGYTDSQGTTGKLIFLLDPSDSFYQSIGGFSMPETIFVDKDGNIVDHKRGPMDLNEIRERVMMLLGISSAADSSRSNTNSVSVVPEVKSELVVYDGSKFSPQTLRVKSGTTVTFRNDGVRPMWVASDPHPIHTNYSAFDARKNIGPGESYIFTFSRIGTWGYHDHLSPSKKGEIIVE